MKRVAALLLACVSLAAIACGRYGPPVRAPRPVPVAPAAEPAPEAAPEEILDTPDEEPSAPSAVP